MKTIRSIIFAFLAVNLLGGIFSSCIKEENFAEGRGVALSFGSDTVSFDTVFTTVGSVTKTLVVYNRESKPVKIDRVSLKNGAASYFRLNVDGDNSLVAKDVEIGAKDSMYVFVRVELNPNNQSNPLLVEDEIVFAFNGKTQSVILQAYGQDAYYHKPSHYLLSEKNSGNGYDTIRYSLADEGGEASGCIVSGNEIHWKADKPHIILGNCVVDSAFVLNLEAGTKIHLNKGSEFWVYKDGTLKANGDISTPVAFESMRKDEHYATTAGQWGCLRFIAGSKNNTLDNVVIKNCTTGIIVDTCVNNVATLTLSNVRIENCSNIGLYSRGATVEAQNLIVQNCGSYAVALSLGGSYNFVHCTFANYWRYNTRTKPCLILNDYYLDINNTLQYRPITRANFYNCIIYGSLAAEEMEFDFINENSSEKHFENCIIKSEKYSNRTAGFVNCIFKDPMFNNASEGDLSVKQNSPAVAAGNGVWSYSVPYDINGTYRPDPPTIGAIEYMEQSAGKLFRSFRKR